VNIKKADEADKWFLIFLFINLIFSSGCAMADGTAPQTQSFKHRRHVLPMQGGTILTGSRRGTAACARRPRRLRRTKAQRLPSFKTVLASPKRCSAGS
jgi:hypothetical protein